jgi:hypothetical protein
MFGDDAFELELVRMDQEPDEALLIIRISSDIGED